MEEQTFLLALSLRLSYMLKNKQPRALKAAGLGERYWETH